MEYRRLGRTGVKVSSLCLGCMNFGGATGEKDSYAMIDRAIEAGINFFDTADVYNLGGSEEMTGKALKRNGSRDRVVLATKVNRRMSETDPNAQGNSRRHIISACEASLRRLQTDYIDLYQLHRVDTGTAADETLRALDDLIRAGKVRYIGTSTYGAWQIVESLWISKELGLNRFVTEQPPYHMLDRSIERELIPAAITYGIAVIPWSPLAGGFLTGKYRRDSRPPGARFTGDDAWGARHFTAESFDALDAIKALAKSRQVPVSRYALAWCMSRPGITSPIIGPRTMEQLEDNLAAATVTMTAEDHRQVDDIIAPNAVVVPYYEGTDADFGPHEHRW